MQIYYPYGLVAIGMAMYIFYTFRKKRQGIAAGRRDELKNTRQLWLDHRLANKKSPIILYDRYMDQKIKTLQKVGEDIGKGETYFLGEETGEKWMKEYPYETNEGGAAQLRKVQAFPYEEQ